MVRCLLDDTGSTIAHVVPVHKKKLRRVEFHELLPRNLTVLFLLPFPRTPLAYPVFVCFVEGVNPSDLDSLKLSSERTALKLDALLLKNGNAREAPDLSHKCLVGRQA